MSSPQHQASLNAIATHVQRGDLATAARLAAALLAASGKPADAAGARFWLGTIAHRERRYPDALTHYEAAREYDRRNPQLLCQLASVYDQSGDKLRAEACYREALRAEPRLAVAHYNLGTLLAARGERIAARRAFEAALGHDPTLIQAHTNLGNALLVENDLPAAERCYQQALALNAHFAEALHGLGLLRARREEHAAAAVLLERALAAAPTSDAIALDLADAQFAVGDVSAALTCLDTLLSRMPDHASARFKRAQYAGDTTPVAAPREILERLYTSMAASFDTHLTGRLGYQIPTLLRERLAPWLTTLVAKPDVLDLGCGTGLFGIEIRPHCGTLIGVDLSTAMLEKAKGRGVYDALHCAELAEYIAAEERHFQLISATDVLIYLGELDTLFGHVAARLTGDGRFAGSIESPADLQAGYRLLPTGRFAHSMAYIAACAARAGLAVVDTVPTVIRLEKGTPIAGNVFMLRVSHH